jgi:hypothetical protein
MVVVAISMLLPENEPEIQEKFYPCALLYYTIIFISQHI